MTGREGVVRNHPYSRGRATPALLEPLSDSLAIAPRNIRSELSGYYNVVVVETA